MAFAGFKTAEDLTKSVEELLKKSQASEFADHVTKVTALTGSGLLPAKPFCLATQVCEVPAAGEVPGYKIIACLLRGGEETLVSVTLHLGQKTTTLNVRRVVVLPGCHASYFAVKHIANTSRVLCTVHFEGDGVGSAKNYPMQAW